MESANARRTQWVPGVGVGVAFLVPAVLGYMLANQLHQQRWGVGWNTSQYFFSYQELGFVSRGLIGSLLAPFPSMQQPGSILALSSLVLLVLVGAAVKGYWRAAAAIEGRGHWVLLLLMASSPALFLHFGFDLGRFDAIGIGIFLGSVAAIRRDAWLLAGVGAAVGLLVHEAFLLLNLPLLAAFALTARDRGGSPIRWGMLAGPPCVALLALGLAGRYEPGAAGLQEIFGRSPRYLTAVGGSVQLDQLAVLTRSVADNWDFVRHEFVATKAYFHWPLSLAWGLVMTLFFRDFHRVNGLPLGPRFWGVFSPLLLSAIACDHHRWIALAAVNMFVVILSECGEAARAKKGITIPLRWPTWMLLASVALGPLGHITSFPLVFLLRKWLLARWGAGDLA